MYINVLGQENFTFEILEECDIENLDQKEQEYIGKFNSDTDGYNLQAGGYNNSQGEGNGRALVTEDDICYIRQSYANHMKPKDVFEKFKDKITKNHFQAIWQGRSWSYIMPEVYTPENKEFYVKGMQKEKAAISKEELFQYRKYYVEHTAKETHEKYLADNLDNDKKLLVKYRTFQKILVGDIRRDSIYNDIPIYKKTQKRWEFKGEPVSTIPESWE